MRINDINSLDPNSMISVAQDYINSLPGDSNKITDFYLGGAGKTIIDVFGGYSSFLAYAAYKNRRDMMFFESKLATTVCQYATSLGYFYNRLSASRLQITFNSEEDVIWHREEPIGEYLGHKLSLLQETPVKKGLNTITVVLGEWNTFEHIISDTKDWVNIHIEGYIDNKFYELRLNGDIIDTVKYPELMESNNILLRSYLDGIYLIFGNGMMGRKANMSDAITLKYIVPTEPLTESVIDLDKVQIYIAGNVVKDYDLTKIIDYGSIPDSVDKMQTIAPGYYFAKRLLLTPKDYNFIGCAYEGLVSCNATISSASCCAANVCYLRFDEKKMTDTQKEEFIKYLETYAVMGMQFHIVDPTPVYVSIKMLVVRTTTANEGDIREILLGRAKSQCMQLGNRFNPSELMNIVIPGVIRSYIEYPISDKKLPYDHYFKLKDFEIMFTEDTTLLLSNGSDKNKGWSYD